MEYIFGQCELALQNLQTDSNSRALSLKSLETAVVKQVEEIHNEVRSSALKVQLDSDRCSLVVCVQQLTRHCTVKFKCFLFPIYLFTVIGINSDLIIAFP